MSAIASTFTSGEPPLKEILDEVHKGIIQLPDFQRGWVWDDDHIRSLIASVSLSYPIGAVLTLETGGVEVRFQPRLVEGVQLANPPAPIRLILDGQQRITSLYLALRSGRPVPTTTEKGRKIESIYYLDMGKAADGSEDRTDAVISVPPTRRLLSDFNRKVDLDVSTPELEYRFGYFPLDVLFDPVRLAAWRRGYTLLHRQDDAKLNLFDVFEAEILQRFHLYRVPTIQLTQNTSKDAVCQVFEKVNMGGVELTVFELVTASFAADEFRLRVDWEERAARFAAYEVLAKVSATDFLQTVTLLASYRTSRLSKASVGCKRKDVLRLSVSDYKATAGVVESGFVAAAKLLGREKIFNAHNLPYQGQLVPLAAICASLEDRFEEDGVKQKLARWYWCGIFGELYGGASESRFAFDIVEVLAWIDGGDEPRTVKEASFVPNRLLTLQSRLAAAYKGLMAKLLQEGSLDFRTGDPIEVVNFFDESVDIHHLFPKAHCEKKKYDRERWNSVVNKAPLTAKTNRIIGGHAPSTYLASLERNHKLEVDRLNEILVSHLVEPALLRSDDFDRFIRHRASRLLDLIEAATGKTVTGRDAPEVIEAFGASLAKI